MKDIRNYILENSNDINIVIKEAEKYLKDFNLKLKCVDSKEYRKNCDFVGMYENDSVFTGEILIYLNYELIKEITDNEYLDDIRVTIFHEIGHALFQLVNDFDEEDIVKYEKDFFDIFNDDNGVEEEDIVEDFGQSFDRSINKKSLLRNLLERLKKDKYKF